MATHPDVTDVEIEELLEPAEDGITLNDDGSAVVDFNQATEEGVGTPGDDSFDDNLADFIYEQDLDKMGLEINEMVEADEESRKEWIQIFSNSVRLLGLKYEERSEPFDGASSVTHPVLIESIVKFQAKAYAELVPAKGPVRTQVIGTSSPEKEAQARRVREFMNYQIMHEMPEWVPEMDILLFNVGLSGSAFKKTYFDATLGRPVSRFVKASDFIVPYSASDLETATRYTDRLALAPNDYRKHVVAGVYRDIDVLVPVPVEEEEIDEEINKVEGTGSDAGQLDQEHVFHEVHLNYDVPGYEQEDGIELPYIITVDKDTGKVLAIRRNWKEKDPRKQKRIWFTHYKFIPGLGFYGYGYLHLIGGLSRTATGTMRNS